MKDRCVVTITIGDDYKRLAKITHPTLQAYAEKCDADFVVIGEQQIAQTTPHWEKFQLYSLLQEYDRVVYLDTDILIRDDCPDLFKLIPASYLGMFNEAPFVERSKELMIDTCKAYAITLPHWDGRYFNTGVMVLSKVHQVLFKKPEFEHKLSFFEQTYLNARIAQIGFEMYELPYQFNRMQCVDQFTGEHRLASYIIHYAGVPDFVLALRLATEDYQTWVDKRGNYYFTRHIHVIVSGGLGDQIQAEPAIRFMKEWVYPDADITVTSHFPELFQHLDVHTCVHGDFKPLNDTPYYIIQSLPPPESKTWAVVSNLLCHTVDYCSIALLRRTLPLNKRRIQLTIQDEDIRYVSSYLKEYNQSRIIIVHAGRHWNTKTFPLSWWQDLIDLLNVKGYTICLIGKDDETRGVLPVICPSIGIDLREKLTLGQLIALIKVAPLLISNDSSPIHIAGAFDNGIILIPSCKHPDHVLPYRCGSTTWRSSALYKKLILDDVSSKPTEIHGSSVEFEVSAERWLEYLPEYESVLEEVQRFIECE